MLYTLSAPYTFEGETVSEIEVALEAMTGQDIIDLQKKYRRISSKKSPMLLGSVAMLASDTDFQLYVLSHLTERPVEFYTGLPACDMLGLCTEMQGFFLKGSE